MFRANSWPIHFAYAGLGPQSADGALVNTKISEREGRALAVLWKTEGKQRLGLYTECSHYNREISDTNDKETHTKGEVHWEITR